MRKNNDKQGKPVEGYRLNPEQMKFVSAFSRIKKRREMIQKQLIQKMQETQQLKAVLDQFNAEGKKMLRNAPPAEGITEVDQ